MIRTVYRVKKPVLGDLIFHFPAAPVSSVSSSVFTDNSSFTPCRRGVIMFSEWRTLLHIVALFPCLVLAVAGTGCDAIKSATQQPDQAAPVPAVVSPDPATPAPTVPSVPPPVVKTPQQTIEEFFALPTVEIRDEHLQQLAALTEGLDTITSLDLTRSGVSDEGLKTLAAFPKLAELILTDTRITNTGLATVATVQSLRTLTLANMRGIDDNGIKSLSPLKALESLTISACSVTDVMLPTLAEFEALQVLNLTGDPDIYGKDFKLLTAKGAFRNLRELHVSGSKFGYYGLEQINKLDQLEVLRASGCEAAGPAISGLGGCAGLRILDLSQNKLQDDHVKGVNKLKKLEELRLSQMNLTDECLNSIKTMKQLKHLDLSQTRVTVDAIKLLKQKFLKDTEILAAGEKF